MRLTDEELAARLRQALDPGNPNPPPESVRELRSLVSRAAPRRLAKPLRSRIAVAAAVFFGASGSAVGAAVASGAALPEPLRVVASGIGLPVDSVGLAQARTDADRLRRDLNRRDLGQVPKDARALQNTFAGLGSDDRRSIGGEVDSLLDRASPYDGRGGDGPSEATGSGSTSVSGDSDNDGGTFPTPTTVPGTQSSGSTDGGVTSGVSTGGDGGGDGGTSSTTATTAPQSDSGGGSTSPTTSGSDGGGGTDGGSISGSDGGN